MDKQSIANIYLADQRGLSLSDQHRSWHTFNYGGYQVPHRKAPGALRVFNEETLAGGQKMSYSVQDAQSVLILPLVGGIVVQTAGQNYTIEAGVVLELSLEPNAVYLVQNPFSDLVSYVQIEVDLPRNVSASQLHTLDLKQNYNTMQAVLAPQQAFQLSIGQFDGRSDVEYFLTKSACSAFVFVIDGVFEVQNRLLHERDGLFLSAESCIEFEALSNEAILLILEF